MKYQDIIDIPHYELQNHLRMPIEARASQFAPFAALDGYYYLIKESNIVLTRKKELTEDTKILLNQKLNLLEKNKPVTIIYFEPVTKKNGNYRKYQGIIKNIDMIEKKIIFQDKKIIHITNILEIK